MRRNVDETAQGQRGLDHDDLINPHPIADLDEIRVSHDGVFADSDIFALPHERAGNNPTIP
jgi:hypothetical protein